MIIQISKDLYDSLSESEKIVVNFLNENESIIPLMSITTIADKTFTSPATVSRAIQKCGFQGISELRYNITNKSDSMNDSYLVNEILAKSYRECTKTIDNICVTSILKVIDYIKNAEKVFIYARGFTALIAEEFHMQLQLLGYNAHIVKDVVWMVKTNRLVNENDVVIILSVMNTTQELATSARLAKESGAKVVSCCCIENSTLEEFSDVTIIGHAEEIVGSKSITITSRLGLTVISRTIVEYLNL